MKVKLKTMEEFITIILLAIIFCSNNLIQILLSIVIIILVMFNRNHYGNLSKKEIFQLLKWYLVPCILIHCYTIVMCLMGIFEFKEMSTNLLTYLPIIVAILIVYQYGQKGCLDVFIAIVLSFLVSFVPKLIEYGGEAVLEACKTFFLLKDNNGGSVFENDDIILAIGYFVIIFFISSFFKRKNTIFVLMVYIFVFVMGGKRIGLVAVAGTLGIFLLLNPIKKNNQKRLCILLGYLVVLAGIIYILLLSNSEFIKKLMVVYGVNLMSRNYFWDSIMKITSFSPNFIGYGRGFVKFWMLDNFSPYQNVHNDYIKMYVEIGLIPYIFWMLYYLVFLQKRFWEKYGNKVGFIYFLTIIFTFILYLTDNTESYFICGLVRCIIPVALISAENKRKQVSVL